MPVDLVTNEERVVSSGSRGYRDGKRGRRPEAATNWDLRTKGDAYAVVSEHAAHHCCSEVPREVVARDVRTFAFALDVERVSWLDARFDIEPERDRERVVPRSEIRR